MRCIWQKRGKTLVPAEIATEKILDAIKEGALVGTGEPVQRRDLPFHRFTRSVLHNVLPHTDFADMDEMEFNLKLKTKMLKRLYISPDGTQYIELKSTDFNHMGEQEYRRVWNLWLWVICNDSEFLPGTDPQDIIKNL